MMRICARVMPCLSLPALIFFTGCFQKAARVNDPTGVGTYTAEAKSQPAPAPSAEGSLWVNGGRRSDLFSDFKARNLNDTVTIRVIENVQALASADAKNSRAADINAAVDAQYGGNQVSGLPISATAKSTAAFDGKGSTSRTTTLQAFLTARVTDVLPNGNLVVEGMREVRVNHENQTLYITGVVRPVDIARNNVVLSSAVAQMAVRVQGRGVVSQPLKPGWLYKILMGIMPF